MVTLKAEEDPTHLYVIFENKTTQLRRTQFNINLIQLDSEHLGIPDTNYSSEITMNSNDFNKLCVHM